MSEEALAIAYDRLRRIAARLRTADATLEPTELVHEVYLKVSRMQFDSALHLEHTVARAIRQVLVDRARRRQAAKRGGDLRMTTLAGIAEPARALDVVVLDQLFEQLREASPRLATVAELRVFGGLEVDEVAAALQVSSRTVKRDWRAASAWLRVALSS